MSEYYEKIIKGKSALTLEDIDVPENVLALGINLTKQQKQIGQDKGELGVRINESKRNKQGFPQTI